jgi:hypothetical protein
MIFFGFVPGSAQDIPPQDVPVQDIPPQNFISRITHHKFSNSGKKNHGFVATPLLFYTPETNLAVGISTILYFRASAKDSLYRPSVVHPFIGYTLNAQFFVESPFQIFLDKEKYYIYGEVDFYKYPYYFYGNGNKQAADAKMLYNAVYPSCSLTVLRKVLPSIYLGLRYNIDYYSIGFHDTANVLYHQQYTGKSGGLNNGIGFQFLYDSRDNIFSSTRGWYANFISVFNAKKFTLSSYNYQWYVFDIRKFISLKKEHILALQAYANFVGGNAPFYKLAQMGGESRMRGYYEGRYRDNDYLTTQAEYRSPFLKQRFGFAVFAGLGMVASGINDFDLHYLKPSVGTGLRLRFNRKEKIHFRVDVAYGKSLYYYFVLS